jgi:hypothetical protein
MLVICSPWPTVQLRQILEPVDVFIRLEHRHALGHDGHRTSEYIALVGSKAVGQAQHARRVLDQFAFRWQRAFGKQRGQLGGKALSGQLGVDGIDELLGEAALLLGV